MSCSNCEEYYPRDGECGYCERKGKMVDGWYDCKHEDIYDDEEDSKEYSEDDIKKFLKKIIKEFSKDNNLEIDTKSLKVASEKAHQTLLKLMK